MNNSFIYPLGAFITSNLVMYFLVDIPLEGILGFWILLIGGLCFVAIFWRILFHEPDINKGLAQQDDELAIRLSMTQTAPQRVQSKIRGAGMYIHNPGPDALKDEFYLPIRKDEIIDEDLYSDFLDKWGLQPVSSEGSNYVFEFESPTGKPTEEMKQYGIAQFEKAKAFKEKHGKRQKAK